MKFFFSLRFRLVLFSLLVEAALLALLVYNGHRLIEYHLVKAAQKQVEDLKHSFNSSLAGLLAARDYASLQSLLDEWVSNRDIAYMALSKEGRTLLVSGLKPGAPIPEADGFFGQREGIYHTQHDISFGGQHFGVLHLGFKTDFVTLAKQELLSQSVLIALIEVFISALLLSVMGYFLTRNLARLASSSEAVARGEYDLSLPTQGRDELALLSRSFTAMAGVIKQKVAELETINRELEARVEEKVAKIRHQDEIIHRQSRQMALNDLLVNIAHHWRQPLNVISVQASLIDDRAEAGEFDPVFLRNTAQTIVDETKDLSRIISLFAGFGVQTRREPLDFEQLTREVAQSLRPLLEAAGFTIAPVEQNVSIEGDPAIWRQLLGIFIQNSAETALQRGIQKPQLSVQIHPDDQGVEITLEDNCGGIAPEALPHLFEPYFTTAFKSRNKGLSLFIAHNLARYALEGSLEAANQNGGARFTLRIPARS